jgi:hypothetical protein
MGFTRKKSKFKRKTKTKKRSFSYKGGMFSRFFRKSPSVDEMDSVTSNPINAKKNEVIMSWNNEKFKKDELTKEESEILETILNELPFDPVNISREPIGPQTSEINKYLGEYININPETLEETIESKLTTLLNGNGTIQKEEDIQQVCLLVYLYLSRMKPDTFVLPFFPEQFISIEQLKKHSSTLQYILKLIVTDNKQLKFLLLEVVLFLCTKDNPKFKGLTPFSSKSKATNNLYFNLPNSLGYVKESQTNQGITRSKSESRINSKTTTTPTPKPPPRPARGFEEDERARGGLPPRSNPSPAYYDAYQKLGNAANKALQRVANAPRNQKLLRLQQERERVRKATNEVEISKLPISETGKSPRRSSYII